MLVTFPKAQRVHKRVGIALPGQIPDQFTIPESFREGFMTINTLQGDYPGVKVRYLVGKVLMHNRLL